MTVTVGDGWRGIAGNDTDSARDLSDVYLLSVTHMATVNRRCQNYKNNLDLNK